MSEFHLKRNLRLRFVISGTLSVSEQVCWTLSVSEQVWSTIVDLGSISCSSSEPLARLKNLFVPSPLANGVGNASHLEPAAHKAPAVAGSVDWRSFSMKPAMSCAEVSLHAPRAVQGEVHCPSFQARLAERPTGPLQSCNQHCCDESHLFWGKRACHHWDEPEAHRPKRLPQPC